MDVFRYNSECAVALLNSLWEMLWLCSLTSWAKCDGNNKYQTYTVYRSISVSIFYSNWQHFSSECLVLTRHAAAGTLSFRYRDMAPFKISRRYFLLHFLRMAILASGRVLSMLSCIFALISCVYASSVVSPWLNCLWTWRHPPSFENLPPVFLFVCFALFITLSPGIMPLFCGDILASWKILSRFNWKGRTITKFPLPKQLVLQPWKAQWLA